MSPEPSEGRLRPLLAFVYWATPPVLCLLLFYRGLWCWFLSDDFSLLLLVTLPDHEFWPALWQPRGQGHFRPLSERLFFYYFFSWFGLDAFPYRVLVFATQFVNLWLLAAITNRITKSCWAGLVAASLWGLHHSLAKSLTWTSAYNQILCSFFFLLSFLLFLRFVASGRLTYYLAQWLTFLLGFGALETMAVYPAVLLSYVLLLNRRYWRHAIPMFLGSAAYLWFHLQASPPASEGLYQPHFDASLFHGLWLYWKWAVGAHEPLVVTLLVGTALLIAVFYQASRRNFLGLFFLAWFVIALAPYLPLREHRSEYYLVIPTIGLAMLGGWATMLAWRARKIYRLAWAAFVVLLLFGSIRLAHQVVAYYQPLSISVKNLVSDVVRARALHSNKTILLTNVPEMLFYTSIAHEAFRLVRVFDVYLAPDHPQFQPQPQVGPIDRFFLTPAETLTGLERGNMVVYDASGLRLTDITTQYSAVAPFKFGRR